MISSETSTKSTTALPRSPSPGPTIRRSATARDGVERVLHRRDDRLAERDEDGQHQRRRHHRDHHPTRDVAPLGIVAAHPLPQRHQRCPQPPCHVSSFLSRPQAHCASETMLISPGNRAKKTVTGRIRKTTGTIIAISFRPPASS